MRIKKGIKDFVSIELRDGRDDAVVSVERFNESKNKTRTDK